MLLRQFATFRFCSMAQLPFHNNQNAKRAFHQDTDDMFKVFTPPKIIEQLNKKVIGQDDAKQILAIAFRDRLRRLRIPLDVRHSVKPSNILMEGPTGCGKTQLCKTLASLSDAPFIRVQATKYTEVGYVGKDVTSIGVELMRDAVAKTKLKLSKREKQQIEKVKKYVDQQIVGSMLGMEYKGSQLWQRRLQDVKQGFWDDRQLTILPGTFHPDKNSFLTQADGEIIVMEANIKELKSSLASIYEKRIKQYIRTFDIDEESIKNAQQNGIVFIDEIDKIAVSSSAVNTAKGVSTEGVQRDFLPLLEGTAIPANNSDKSPKVIRTDNILFIAGGSFARVKVQDMLPELLGRLPVRVNLRDIKESDLIKILQKQHGLIQQQFFKMKTQGVNLQFSEQAIKQIARIAYNYNIFTQNLGARRLSSMINSIMTKCSLNAHEYAGTTYLVTKDHVLQCLKDSYNRHNLRSKLI